MNLSVKDAANLLSVSEKTIYRWIKQEIIPVYKIHEGYRFRRAELIEWATSRRMGMPTDALDEPEAAEQPPPSLYEALETGGIYYRIEGRTRDAVLADAVDHLRLPEEIDRRSLTQALVAREQLASTAVGDGIAIPHPRTPGMFDVIRTTLTLCFLEHPVDFASPDGKPVDILLLIVSPLLRDHLHLLSRLGFVLKDVAFYRALRNNESREKLFAALAAAEARLVS